MLNFIHGNLDKREPVAVALTQADITKAFNSVSHRLIIQDMYDMHVPGWILRIIISFLTERNMTLHFNGVESKRHFLRGSAPQGIYLGVLIFLIKFNGAFLRPPIPREILPNSSLRRKNVEDFCHSNHFTGKYVDGACKAAAFDLRKCLEINKNP